MVFTQTIQAIQGNWTEFYMYCQNTKDKGLIELQQAIHDTIDFGSNDTDQHCTFDRENLHTDLWESEFLGEEEEEDDERWTKLLLEHCPDFFKIEWILW